MKINDNSRPSEVTSNEIWELYKLLESLDEHYVLYDRHDAPQDREELFYLAGTTVGDDGMVYESLDSIGLQLPYSKNEWVELTLENMANGRKQKTVVRIEVNTLLKKRLAIDELLEKNHIRIPAADELAGYEYEEVSYGSGADAFTEKLPVVHFPVPINNNYAKRKTEAERAAYWMEKYLRHCSVPYKKDRDGGVTRFTFVFMCGNVPGGFVEGCIWFWDKAAEARVYYNQMGADICKGSSHRPELLRLLNFINARVFMDLNDGGNRWYDPQILHTPRIYLTEDECYDISMTTMINYRFWREAEEETHDYLTAYCPELLDLLAPFIFDTLRGDITVEDAISGICADIIN